MSRDLVGCTVADGIATLTLDNPPLNLVTIALTRALGERVRELAGREDVRVLIVTGAGGRAFCAGSDVREFPGLHGPGQAIARKLGAENAAFDAVRNFPRPTIAALNGLAYGGGLELAVCCDILIADPDARFALPEIRLGIIPGSGGTVRVTRRIGEGRAREMMYTGDPIDAETALHWGLINRIAARGQALDAATSLAARLAAGSPDALHRCKDAVGLAFDRAEQEGVARSLDLVGELFLLPDCAEGVRTFIAKRPPRFGAG